MARWDTFVWFDDTTRWVDPVSEVLAFFGLSLFPVGVRQAMSGSGGLPLTTCNKGLRTDGGRRFRFT